MQSYSIKVVAIRMRNLMKALETRTGYYSRFQFAIEIVVICFFLKNCKNLFLQVFESATTSLPNVSLLDQHSELLKQAESTSGFFTSRLH